MPQNRTVVENERVLHTSFPVPELSSQEHFQRMEISPIASELAGLVPSVVKYDTLCLVIVLLDFGRNLAVTRSSRCRLVGCAAPIMLSCADDIIITSLPPVNVEGMVRQPDGSFVVPTYFWDGIRGWVVLIWSFGHIFVLIFVFGRGSSSSSNNTSVDSEFEVVD